MHHVDGQGRADPPNPAAARRELSGRSVLFASLDHLIAMKDASGRTKDKLMATEYRVLSDEIRRRGD